MLKSRTVELKGAKEVSVVTTGYENTNFTIVLSITYDGGKLSPMVIFYFYETGQKQLLPSFYRLINFLNFMSAYSKMLFYLQIQKYLQKWYL